MVYGIYAYSTAGISITYEILQELGYKIARHSPMWLRDDFEAGFFSVNVEKKTVEYFLQTVGYGTGRTKMEDALNARTAFRAAVFINKYQKV